MTVIALGSVRGGPGVTTTSLLLAGAMKEAVLVEADLAGGVLAVRYQLGREPGLTTYAAEASTENRDWLSHAQLAGGVPVLVGPDSPKAAANLWNGAGNRLTSAFFGRDVGTVIVDVGRFGDSSPLLPIADRVVVVARPTAEHLVTLSHRLPTLSKTASVAEVAVLLVGEGPYSRADVEASLDVRTVLSIPDDSRGASMLVDGATSRSAFSRTRLARSAEGLSDQLNQLIGEPSSEPVGADL